MRLIYQVVPEFGINYEWQKEEIQKGLFIKINLDEIIEEIVLSPFAEEEFLRIVEGMLNSYRLLVFNIGFIFYQPLLIETLQKVHFHSS